jgi:CheY-like chemotaxis protein
MRPDAITLDLRLPDMAGWVVLDRLKHDPGTRHIPVHVISGDESWRRGVKRGAFATLHKPVDQRSLQEAFTSLQRFLERRVKEILIVEDGEAERMKLLDSIGEGDVRATAVGSATEALAALKSQSFDCLVVDLGLPDMPGVELIEAVKRDRAYADLPVIVYTARDLSSEDQARLDALVESIIIKDSRSMERLLGETALFLHRLEENLTPAAKGALRQVQEAGEGLAGKKVLIVDDDVRNIFALASMLERWGMATVHAEDGLEALRTLREEPGVDAVLMDIMMPGMDGYQTTREIRGLSQFRELPIIALTAKAMKDDRRKCLESGASDYIAKPVQSEQLRSLLRVWLGERAKA